MRLAILSDTHDNIWQLDRVMPYLMDADAVLHCGDLISPFVIVRFGQALGDIPVHIVWGNNDGDKRLLVLKAQEAGNIHIHGESAFLELGGLKIAMNHYPEIARGLAYSGLYDLVCYGHDHTAHEEMIGNTTLLNPGEIMGLNGRRSFVYFETRDKSVQWIDLDEKEGEA